MHSRLFIKRFFLIICLILLGAVLASITAFVFIFKDEFRTVSTLEEIDDYGMYTMEYHGDYDLDGLLNKGIKNDTDIGRYVVDNLLKDNHFDKVKEKLLESFQKIDGGCTSFVARNENGEVIYGRNYDYIYSPSLVLKTEPTNGYKSISTVNLSLLGFTSNAIIPLRSRERLTWFEGTLMLLTPFLPFDGMNEKGVAISMLTVPEAQPPLDFSKPLLNPTLAIRLVLDKASNVEEAIALLSKYNIYFSGNLPCHFLIGDSSGDSVIIEYLDKEMKIIHPTSSHQSCSNFVAFDERKGGGGRDRCELIDEKVKQTKNRLTHEDALDLLARTGGYNGSNDSVQWSVLYNLTDLTSEIFAHRKVKDRTFFSLMD